MIKGAGITPRDMVMLQSQQKTITGDVTIFKSDEFFVVIYFKDRTQFTELAKTTDEIKSVLDKVFND